MKCFWTRRIICLLGAFPVHSAKRRSNDIVLEAGSVALPKSISPTDLTMPCKAFPIHDCRCFRADDFTMTPFYIHRGIVSDLEHAIDH
ncbi:hypothetical protein CPB85DRAFT_297200 [Mucidula mucida]|nr:hypothetical protein CPB85DRAFT_297200 [Mucidula mucida]